MDDDGEAGAIAAAEYLFTVVAYVDETRNIDELAALSMDECSFCSNRIDRARQSVIDGEYIDESIFDVIDTRAAPPDSESPWWLVRIVGQQHQRDLLDNVGEMVRSIDPTEFDLLVYLDRSGGRWAIREVTVEDETSEEASS